MGFYDYSVPRPDGTELSMADFKGKVVLVVNTATACGFTPQYTDIVNLYHTYHDAGLEVVDVPCNQFREQAPGTDEEIAAFCQMRYSTPFEQMKKSDVKGANALPLFTFLTGEKGFEGFGRSAKGIAMATAARALDRDYASNPEVKWNFTKFVISREGDVIARFEPTAAMEDVEALIATLI